MNQLGALYDVRFSEQERVKKERVWQVLCRHFFQKFIRPTDAVLELACGFGEFLGNIDAKRKVAVDLNDQVQALLPKEIEFHLGSADNLTMLESNTIDVVFVSNFFEHLPNKDVLTNVLKEIHRVLKPGGSFMMMQPNFKYCYDAYWDFYDHHLPLSHLTMIEGLEMTNFAIEKVHAKFVPFSTKSKIPSHPLLVRIYLMVPFVWKIMGKQFFILAKKPT
ncbi:MAG: class I SAM-dependent methyltransferase [Bdellovibrionales bacterium]|nr:class I SAM-dependent methyltransferase [Bdellovibrionales bacterium]